MLEGFVGQELGLDEFTKIGCGRTGVAIGRFGKIGRETARPTTSDPMIRDPATGVEIVPKFLPREPRNPRLVAVMYIRIFFYPST